MPERIQMTRQRPWRIDHPDAVKVDRSTKWGNPFPVVNGDRAEAVRHFSEWLPLDVCDAARAELAGKDLACWCPPGQPCHGDVLLTIANRPLQQDRGDF